MRIMATPIDTRHGLILALLLLVVPGANGAPVGDRDPATAQPAPWNAAAIRASHILHPVTEGAVKAPAPGAPTRYLVVEAGDDHASLLEGERLERIHRWPTRPGLRGAPGFSADGRYAYFTSGGGWVSKYDLHGLETVAEIRVGIRSRNAALSGDGRYLLVANEQPHTLVVLDAEDLGLREVITVRDEEGRGSRVAAVHAAPARHSFIAALQDIPELWELRYDDGAPPVYQGLVHDFRLGEGVPVPGDFPPRRVLLEAPLGDLLFDPDFLYVLGVTGQGRLLVIDLDARRRLAAFDLPGMPRPGAGVRWQREGRTLLALPNQSEGLVSVIDEARWELVETIPTRGPGYFLASHENSPYLWGAVSLGPHQGVLHLIDKQTLEIAHRLRPEPGKRVVQLVFSEDGSFALVSIGEEAGAVVVYDTASLAEVRRIPARRPQGVYPVAAPRLPACAE